MEIQITDESVEIKLSPAERLLGLMKDISVPIANIYDAQVLDDGVREAMSTGIKAGLRVPWLRYVARTITLDQVFIVRRGLPALAFSVRDHGALRRVVVSTREAPALAKRLQTG